ncbi:MAG: sugar phosphate isomerase/epimerase [Clostridium sp.]|jgi:sugar phosphate isomerase/epimerase
MKSLRNYMKIGIIHSMAFPSSFNNKESLIESFKQIALDDYFDVIEIGEIKNQEAREQIKQLLEVSKLTPAYGGQSRLLCNGLNINDLNEEGRVKAVGELKKGINEAYYMGAVDFSFLSGHYVEEKKEEALEALVRSTSELCSYAARKGNMIVLLEVFDYDIDKKSILGPVELVKRYAKQVSSEHKNFGIMVDLSHLPQLRETPRQALLPIKEYVRHVHIGNAVVKDSSLEAYGDLHPRFGFPHSENDVEELVEFLKVILEIGYLNIENPPIVSFEVKPRPYEDEMLVIAGSKRVLNEALAKIMEED